MTISSVQDIPSFKWATVRSISPISVQLDGDPAPLALIPDCLVDPASLAIGNRVRVELSKRKVVIHGRNNGTPPPTSVPTEGLAANKPANPKYWQFYFETDTQRMMVGSRTGTWRQYSGTATVVPGAWVMSSTSGTVITVGRTISWNIPTVLESHELLQVVASDVGTGFGFIGPSSQVRNPTNVTITVRHMQLGSVAQQALSILWQITPSIN